jgi:hypothetical protein
VNSDRRATRIVPKNQQRELERTARQRSRERQKIFGLLLIVLLILVLTFVRFGRTIPWGAR